MLRTFLNYVLPASKRASKFTKAYRNTDEVRLVSDQFLGQDQKILIENATEAKVRLTDFTNYDFLHFRFMGLFLEARDLENQPLHRVHQKKCDLRLMMAQRKLNQEFDFTDKLVFPLACQTV